jgi:hypothetical protein
MPELGSLAALLEAQTAYDVCQRKLLELLGQPCQTTPDDPAETAFREWWARTPAPLRDRRNAFLAGYRASILDLDRAAERYAELLGERDAEIEYLRALVRMK